jgi:ABC-2 type transport system permease protein
LFREDRLFDNVTMDIIKIYLKMAGAYIQARMEYKAAFLITLFGMVLMSVTDFIFIYAVFSRFQDLHGWTIADIGVLFSVSLVAISFSRLFAGELLNMNEQIVEGRFDRVLVRPYGSLFQMISSRFEFHQIGRLAAGAIMLIIACEKAGIRWTIGKALFFPTVIVSGTIIQMALLILCASVNFWTTRADDLEMLVVWASKDAINFPISVYRRWVQIFLSTALPIAFINYFPCAYLLDKPDVAGFPSLLRFASPIVALAILLVAVWVWNRGVNTYESVGA